VVTARLRLAYVGMHPERRAELVSRLGSADAVLAAIRRGSVEVPAAARQAADISGAVRLEQLAGDDVRVVFREDLPKHLGELPDAPDVLFVKGALPHHPGVAVVGSRKATVYGTSLSRRYGWALADAGWPVVSGLALGVDGAAHVGVVDADGIGVAVLGCGPDVWYPRQHRSLGRRLVAAGGALVTEYPPGTPPNGWRFPPRNRIISGLARVVVVVEAARTGGALITARKALGQGRDVFAVPGDIDRPTSEGCNRLIRDGALPVFGPDDLVEAVSVVLGPPARHDVPSQHAVLDAVGPVGRSVDDLSQVLSKPVSWVLAEVARLEAAGLVCRRNGLVARGR
jgi:DNA processing protein